jgi:alkylhydroperoxidase family enzyme
LNAAVGSDLGYDTDTLTWVVRWTERPDLFDERERVALEYADAITLSDSDVDDALFGRVQQLFDDDAIVELTELIAWENASSKFNRALRIGSQHLWAGKTT